MNKKVIASTAAALALQAMCTINADAQTFRGYASHCRHSYGTYMAYHPMVHNAVKDGAIGTAAGALVGLASGRGLLHGALVGAGTGAGIGALRASSEHWRHPVGTNVATAGIAGLGLFLAARHGHGW